MTEIPDIVERCLAASADDRLSSGPLYREAAEEIKRLRLAIARIAEQDATLTDAVDVAVKTWLADPGATRRGANNKRN